MCRSLFINSLACFQQGSKAFGADARGADVFGSGVQKTLFATSNLLALCIESFLRFKEWFFIIVLKILEAEKGYFCKRLHDSFVIKIFFGPHKFFKKKFILLCICSSYARCSPPHTPNGSGIRRAISFHSASSPARKSPGF